MDIIGQLALAVGLKKLNHGVFRLRGGGYFPVNIIQGVVELSGDQLMPRDGNTAVSSGTELTDFIDSVEAVMSFFVADGR